MRRMTSSVAGLTTYSAWKIGACDVDGYDALDYCIINESEIPPYVVTSHAQVATPRPFGGGGACACASRPSQAGSLVAAVPMRVPLGLARQGLWWRPCLCVCL